MAQRAATCMGCNGPIENPSAPGIVRAQKTVKPATLAGRIKEAGDNIAYFHAGCFRGQSGYEPV